MQTTETRISELKLELDHVIEKYHASIDDFVKGNPRPFEELFSQRADLILANPFNPVARGWHEAKETMERAAAQYRDGVATGFESLAKYVDPGLAYIVEIEHFNAKIGKKQDAAPIALRVTTIFRREDDAWKIIHRHADPITTVQPWESVVKG